VSGNNVVSCVRYTRVKPEIAVDAAGGIGLLIGRAGDFVGPADLDIRADVLAHGSHFHGFRAELHGIINNFNKDEYFFDITARHRATRGEARIPEPSSLTLVSLGILMLLGYAWRSRRSTTVDKESTMRMQL